MSGKSTSGFAGLVVEGALIGLVVALLPKLPLGSSAAGPARDIADQRPVVPSIDPTYVEDRLDHAGQQLVGGLATYLSREAEEVLAAPAPMWSARSASGTLPHGPILPPHSAPPTRRAPSFTPPQNAYRY